MQGSLVKKGSRWYVKVYTGKDEKTGKYKQKWYPLSATTEREAAKERDRLLVAQEDPNYVEPSKLTVSQFLDQWVKDYVEPRLTAKTVRWYKMNINYHITPRIGTMPLHKIAPLHILRLLNQIEGQDTTIKGVYSTLRAALNKAVDWQIIAKNPVNFVDAPRIEKRTYQTLSVEGIGKLLETAQQYRNYGVYLTALTTAMRLEEIAGLRWDYIDLNQKIIRVEWQLIKGGKEPVFGKTKGKDKRWLPLTDVLIEELQQIQHRQKLEKIKAGPYWEENGLVFTTFHRYYGRPIDGHNLSRREFKKILEKAELPDMRFHDLRHSVATLLLELGEPIEVVSKILGHSSIVLTDSTYLHPSVEFKRPAINKLEEIIRRKPNGTSIAQV